MPSNKMSPDLLTAASDARRRSVARRPPLTARLQARLRAHQLDRQLAVGVPASAASALAVHQKRLMSVAEREAGTLTVEVADDGIGLPDGFEIGRASKSLGMRVVGSLARQLGGTLTLPPMGQGATFRLAVPLEKGIG